MRELRASTIRAAATAAGELSPLFGNLGSHQPPDHHQLGAGAALLRRGADPDLRLQPRRGDPLVQGRHHARSDLRDVLLGDRPRPRPEHQRADGRRGRAGGAARRSQKADRAGAGAPARPSRRTSRRWPTRYSAAPGADRVELDLAYANAMRELAAQYPDDLDAVTLFAEALMDLTPWKYWTTDGQATEYTPEIVATLESVLARNPNHPGANHYYIHAVEASQTPGAGAARAPNGWRRWCPAPATWSTCRRTSTGGSGSYPDAVRVNEHGDPGGRGDVPTRRPAAPIRAATASTRWPTTRTTSTSCSPPRRCRAAASWR